jgi:hypothetical protein
VALNVSLEWPARGGNFAASRKVARARAHGYAVDAHPDRDGLTLADDARRNRRSPEESVARQ